MSYVTLKDIAKVANVSYATVSRALSGSKQIGEETRQRILKLCEEMGYTADYVARSMVTGSTKTIGLIVTNVNNPFMSEIAGYIERQSRAAGFDLMLCSSMHDVQQEEKAFQLLLGRRVDGIIVVPTGHDSFKALDKYLPRIPTVFVSENARGLPVHYVAVDNYTGSRIGMEYLVSLGHRRVVYFGRRKDSVSHQRRAMGYLEICEKYGLVPSFFDNPGATSSIEHGYQMAKQLLLERRGEFSAIFASSDTNALGIIKAADELGIRIPQDISVLGFDNISYADLPKVDLSTVEQPKEEIAARAVTALVDMIRGKKTALLQETIQPRLIVRKSCVRPDASVR